MAGFNHLETVHVCDARGEFVYACVIDTAEGIYDFLSEHYRGIPMWLFVEDARAFQDVLAYDLIERAKCKRDNNYPFSPTQLLASVPVNGPVFFDPRSLLLPERLRRYHTRETLVRQWLPKEQADELLAPSRSGANGYKLAEKQAKIWYALCKAAGL